MAWGIDRDDCVFCGRALTADPDAPAPFPPVCDGCSHERRIKLVAEAAPDPEPARAKYLTGK